MRYDRGNQLVRSVEVQGGFDIVKVCASVVNDCLPDSATMLCGKCLFLCHHLFEVEDPIDIAKDLVVFALQTKYHPHEGHECCNVYV
jgi:hypothetical protein